jgi:hypothetical protein
MPSTKEASPTKTAAPSYRSLRRRQFERRHSKAKMRPQALTQSLSSMLNFLPPHAASRLGNFSAARR